MKRIGLFGGTFNPIHRGHLHVIQETMEAFKLDQVKLIPAALPPHKEPGGVADAQDRLQMIRLAISNYPSLMPSVAVSDVELKRPGPSYTIDTVRYFMQVLPQNTELFFILGLDAFHEINTWKSYLDLFELVPFIVVARPGVYGPASDLKREFLEKYLKSKISKDYRFSVSRSCYVHAEKQPIFVFDVSLLEISSTQIRESVKHRRSITSLVAGNVEEFIKTKGLYL